MGAFVSETDKLDLRHPRMIYARHRVRGVLSKCGWRNKLKRILPKKMCSFCKTKGKQGQSISLSHQMVVELAEQKVTETCHQLLEANPDLVQVRDAHYDSFLTFRFLVKLLIAL